ncbi:MaoC family dehydratase N-terminal domain-containing protein [Mesorhizobium sp. YR577]|uniref:FAS1-like dehydratase domain-containing protein n=1 Tax=Mesorhizobium sp. YR577 TaxID=1884373 RepID=UPI0008E45869|nr:MaoC family dehydratase N-terminal domain-containing protein [Mesorhizobium sp. YR577]SFU19548.1 3-methylfumaryl-CoA hydratase [Mesorhizobium sp. YR577]
MTDVDINYLRTWIGRERSVSDVITPRLAASLDAVLDIERNASPGAAAPVGIHWCLAPDIVPMRGIGRDGHPARGSFLPPVPFPRRMWAGGELAFSGDFRIGDEVSRVSTIENVELKKGQSGKLIFVTVRHRYATSRGRSLDERQDIVYRELESASIKEECAPTREVADYSRHVEANSVLLFRYSAITFNGHRIHYDEPYVTGEEGYPGLIFHGPLQATLLLDLATERRNGNSPRTFAFRSTRPLFSGGRISTNARSETKQTSLWISDQENNVTMEAWCK